MIKSSCSKALSCPLNIKGCFTTDFRQSKNQFIISTLELGVSFHSQLHRFSPIASCSFDTFSSCFVQDTDSYFAILLHQGFSSVL